MSWAGISQPRDFIFGGYTKLRSLGSQECPSSPVFVLAVFWQVQGGSAGRMGSAEQPG